MSTRVRLLFNFPQYRVIAQSIVTITLGVCSIGASIFGFWVKIWGYYIYTGAWAGGLCVVMGALGIHASRFKGVCTVKLFMVMAYIAFLASVAQLVLSVGGIIDTSSFYTQEEARTNGGTTRLIHGLLTGFGVFQSILSLICAAICSRLLCCFKPNQMKTDNTRHKRSVSRYDSKASTSSHRPLVQGERGRKSKRKKEEQNGSSLQASKQKTFRQIGGTSDSGSRPIIRGRRYGNAPIVGSNVVELMEKQDKLKLLPINYNENRSNRSLDIEIKPIRPHKDRNINFETNNRSTSGSGGNQGGMDLGRSNQGISRGGNSILYADGVESPDGETTGFKSFQRNSFTRDTHDIDTCRISPNVYARSFIPIENAVEEPLSIEEDEELPPYEEAIKENKDTDSLNVAENTYVRSCDATSNIFQPLDVQPEFNVVPDGIQNSGYQVIDSDLCTVSTLDGPVSPYFINDTPVDPQGVSYCSVKRNKDNIFSSLSTVERRSHGEVMDLLQNPPTSEQKGNLLKNEIMKLSVDSSPDIFSRRDPRRISVSSTMSLPVGYAPPKPPRLFHKDYTSLKTFVSSDSLNTLISPTSLDKSLDSVRSETVPHKTNAVVKKTDERGSAPAIYDKRKPVSNYRENENVVFRYDKDNILPLSSNTAELREESLKSSVPNAHSSPKLKGWDELTKQHKSPGISPIRIPDMPKQKNAGEAVNETQACRYYDTKTSNNNQNSSSKDNSLSLKPYLIKSTDGQVEHSKKDLTDASVDKKGACGFSFNENKSPVVNVMNEHNIGSVRQHSQTDGPERSKSYPRMKAKHASGRRESSSGDEHKGSDRPSLSVLERKLPLPSSFMSSSCAPVLSVWKGSENCDPVIDASTHFITAVDYANLKSLPQDENLDLGTHNSSKNLLVDNGNPVVVETVSDSSRASTRPDTGSVNKPLLQQVDDSSQSGTSNARSPSSSGKPIYSILL